MQIYAIRMFNFFRFGEKNNSVVFDLTKEYSDKLIKNKDMNFDQIYDEFQKTPIEYVEKVKAEGITPLIGISGIIGDDSEVSNGAGKSTILEGIVYALYNKIVRKNVNSDKTGDAGLDVVLNFNGVYPKTLRDSYVEIFFEENDLLYRVKRGRTFTKNQKPIGPYLEFECVSEEVDSNKSRGSHRTGTTTKKIEDVIDRDYDTFCSSLMFGQNDSGKFLIGTDKVKKDMLISVLHFDDAVKRYLTEVRDRKKTHQDNITGLETKVEVLEERVGKETVASLEIQIKTIKGANKGIKSIIEDVDKELTKVSSTDEAQRLAEIKEKGKQKKEELVSLQERIDEQTTQWKKFLSDTETDISLKKNDLSTISSKIVSVSDEKTKKARIIAAFNEEEFKNTLEKIEKAKAVKPKYTESLESKRKEKEELVKGLTGYETELKPIQKEIVSLKAQIEANKDKDDDFICDKCKSKVSKQHILDELETNSEKEKSLQGDLKEAKSKLEEMAKEVTDLEVKLKKLDDWVAKEVTVKSEKQSVEEAKVRVKELSSDIIEREKSKTTLEDALKKSEESKAEYLQKIKDIEEKSKDSLSKIREELKVLADEYKTLEKGQFDVATKIKELQNKKKELGQTLERNIGMIGGWEASIKSIQDDENKIAQYKKDLDEKKSSLRRILVLEEVCGIEGVQTKIVQKYLPLLNVYIKEVMDVISQGSIEEEVIINKQGHVDIVIRGGTASTYPMLSGGEKMVVRLATDIGLAMLSFSHCAQKPEIICLDEIFGPLDDAHTGMVFDLLEELKAKFNRVLAISHKKAINDTISCQIVVGKHSGEYGLSYIKDIRTTAV